MQILHNYKEKFLALCFIQKGIFENSHDFLSNNSSPV